MTLIMEYLLGSGIYGIIAIITYVFTTYCPALPMFNYGPYTCYKCLRFWTSWWVAIGMALMGLTCMGITIGVLATFDAYALDYNERCNTEYINDDKEEDEI